MSDHEKLAYELGAGPGDVDGIELTDEELEGVAGGAETTIISSTTIIRGGTAELAPVGTRE